MKLSAFFYADKTSVSHGAWGEHKIRARDFPLSRKRGKAYPLTKRWRWRVSKVEACGARFRLMTAYHTIVPEFLAILAEEVPGDSKILARLEFHQTHRGWHAHVFCGDTSLVTAGITKPHGEIRIPAANAYHRNCDLLGRESPMTDDAAAAIVASFFRLPDPPDLFSAEALPWMS